MSTSVAGVVVCGLGDTAQCLAQPCARLHRLSAAARSARLYVAHRPGRLCGSARRRRTFIALSTWTALLWCGRAEECSAADSAQELGPSTADAGCGCGAGALTRQAMSADVDAASPAHSWVLPSGTVASESLPSPATAPTPHSKPDSSFGPTPAAGASSTAAVSHLAGLEPAARMVYIPGAEFMMGHSNRSLSPSTFDADGEGPPRIVQVSLGWCAPICTRPPRLGSSFEPARPLRQEFCVPTRRARFVFRRDRWRFVFGAAGSVDDQSWPCLGGLWRSVPGECVEGYF